MDKDKWPIKTEIILQWGDMDAFSHVNNINYIKWCETSRVELFRKMWGDKKILLSDIIKGNGVGPILANFNINYRTALVYPDVAYIYTRVRKIGNSSFVLEHLLKSKNNGDKIIADCSSVVVMYNYLKEKKHQLSEIQKADLKEYS